MTRPPPDSYAPEALARLIDEFGCLVHRTRGDAMDRSLAIINEAGLTVPQMIALHMLDQHGVHSVSEIADRTQLSRPATSHLVNRLVDQGMVDRIEDPVDRRQKQISLSAKGREFTSTVIRGRISAIESGLRLLSEATREALGAALTRAVSELMHLKSTKQQESHR